MLIAQGMLIAQEAAVPMESLREQPDTGNLVVIFVFVAFCIVAGLISKHLTMRHEQTLKFGDARKAQALNDADGTSAGSGPPWWYVLLAISAALVSGLIILSLHGEQLGSLATVFVFVAFCVVAGLISKQMKMKHEQKLKQAELGKFPSAKPNSGWSAGLVLLAIAFFGGLAMLSLMWLSLARTPRVGGVAAVGTVNAVSGLPPAVLPNLKRWNEDIPFAADQYPSITACAEPLARQIVKEIQAMNEAAMTAEATGEEGKALPAESTGISVGHSGFSDKDFSAFTAALKESFKSMKPSVFLAESSINSRHHFGFHLKDVDQFEDAFPDKPIRLKRGIIDCKWMEKLDTGEKKYFEDRIKPVSFIEKPWLTNFAHFTSLYPESRFYIGATEGVEPLRSKAHDRAVQDVANRLNLKSEQIEPQIAGRFTQTIERPYGKVYREAILVQNPPKVRAFDSVAGVIAPSVQRSLLSRVVPTGPPSFEFFLAMIVCLTVIAGFVSNIATQGYYRTKISNTSLAVAALVVGLILLNVVMSIVA